MKKKSKKEQIKELLDAGLIEVKMEGDKEAYILTEKGWKYSKLHGFLPIQYNNAKNN